MIMPSKTNLKNALARANQNTALANRQLKYENEQLESVVMNNEKLKQEIIFLTEKLNKKVKLKKWWEFWK